MSTRYYEKAQADFLNHYETRIGNCSIHPVVDNHDSLTLTVKSESIKPGNEPRLFLHKKSSKHALVISHGLSDSPHYVSAIAEEFFHIGVNVVVPLMPAHGLIDPDKAMEDYALEDKWRKEFDIMTNIASKIGDVISVGGFSKGGALAYNKILRDPDSIKGGLFLFAASLDVRLIGELGRVKFMSTIAKITDGKIVGYGMDPYKYPKLPMFAALELGQIINENEKLSNNQDPITQPVFAAHSIDDITAKIEGIKNLLEKKAKKGILYTLSNGMAHAELPLKDDIIIDDRYTGGKPAYANPDFGIMMDACVSFFQKYVEHSEIA
jgi:esterase/lipase